MTENGNKTETRTFANQAVLHSSDTVKWWEEGEADRKCLQDEIPSQTDIDQNVLLFFWIIGHVDWFFKKMLVFNSYNLN